MFHVPFYPFLPSLPPLLNWFETHIVVIKYDLLNPQTVPTRGVRRWLGILSEELAVRMLKDRHERNRRPRTLQLYYRGAATGDRSKSQPLPFQAMHLLSQPTSSRPPKKDTGGSAVHDFDNRGAGGEGPGLDLVAQLGEVGDGVGGGEGGDGVDHPTVLSLAAVLEGAAFSMLEKAEGALPCSRLALAASDFQDMQVQVRVRGGGSAMGKDHRVCTSIKGTRHN